MILEFLEQGFSICKMRDSECPKIRSETMFFGRTDGETSLVCPSTDVPTDCVLERNDGWRAFRVVGTLDFSLIGILSKITGTLADNGIGVFVISTFDTDYVLVRDGDISKTRDVLSDAGYGWKEA